MSLFSIARYAESLETKGQEKHKLILEKVKADSRERKRNSNKTSTKRPHSQPTTFSPKVPKYSAKDTKPSSIDFSASNLKDVRTVSGANIPPPRGYDTCAKDSLQEETTGKKSVPDRIGHVGNTWSKSYDPLKEFKTGLKRQKELTIIGDDMDVGWQEDVAHKLPDWIEYPIHISSDIADRTNTDALLNRLDSRLRKNLSKMGVTKLFPVQKSIIPPLLWDTRFGPEISISRPNDICVCSPTGSGKTLAFALPILNAIMQYQESATRALIVLPTVELAKQIQQVFFCLTKGCKIHCALLGGSQTLLEEAKSLAKVDKYGERIPPAVIICTPGRLVHYLETSSELKLNKLRFLVIDEADRILDQVKHSWIERLEKCIEQERTVLESTMTLCNIRRPGVPLQKLLFSATLSTDPEKLEVLHLFQPRLFTSSPKTLQSVGHQSSNKSVATKYLTPAGLQEYRIHCGAAQKPLQVISLVKKNPKRILCFVGSTEASHRLALLLQEFAKVEIEQAAGNVSFTSAEFSSLLTKKERKRQLSRFKSGKTDILVCSDAAARGLDVDDVQQVILYDAPKFLETYIHRVGRTSRAGKQGTAYTLVCTNEMRNFGKMFKDAGRNCPQKTSMESSGEIRSWYETALGRMQSKLS